MAIRLGILAPCVGVGGGDQFFSSLIRFTPEFDWTGIHVEHGATWEQYERARRQSGGRIAFHQSFAPPDGRRHPACEYHTSAEDSAAAACGSADALISWHCLQTAAVAKLFPRPIIEVSQNQDGLAQFAGKESEAYASQLVAVSRAAGKAAFGDRPFRIIPNGIEFDRCSPRFGRHAQRQLWAIPENGKTILFAGRLSEEKNPEVLIDALGMLPDYFNLLFVGEGKLWDRIADRASRVCRERIRMVPAQESLGDAFAASDVFVLPSDVEGDSLAAKEALAAGLPVVVSDAGSAADLNADFGGGLWDVIPKRPEAGEVAAAIIKARPSAARQAYAFSNFGIGHIARLWEDFLQAVVFESKRLILDIQQAELVNRLQATPVQMFRSPRDQKGGADEIPNR